MDHTVGHQFCDAKLVRLRNKGRAVLNKTWNRFIQKEELRKIATILRIRDFLKVGQSQLVCSITETTSDRKSDFSQLI